MIPIAGVIGGVLAAAAVIPYVISILRGVTRPNRATYGIWAGVNIVSFASYASLGARATIWVPLAFAISELFVFALSLRYGMGGAGKVDICCLVLAAMAIGLWIVTKRPEVAFGASYIAAMLGFLPTIKKARQIPWTENNLAWAMTGTASCLNLLALTTMGWRISLLPISSAVCNSTIALLVIFPRSRSATRRRSSRLSEAV